MALRTERTNDLRGARQKAPRYVFRMVQTEKELVRKDLSNGIRVIMEPMDSARSVCIGIWVNAGSIAEAADEAGITHFIEHMNFKGTKKRSAKLISQEMDSIGGNLNAFTAKDCTCFYAQVLEDYLPEAVDILSDIVLSSTFPVEELEKERHVVVEEILMNDDSPEDVSSEAATGMIFEGDPLSLPILGTEDSILSVSPQKLVDYRNRHYTTGNLVVSIAGRFDPEKAFAVLENAFAGAIAGERTEPYPAGCPQLITGRKKSFSEKDAEQVHITLALPGFSREDGRKYSLSALSSILGGSMSSRLFQSIREERGLCYSVYSYGMSYRYHGTLMLYAGTSAANAATVTGLMLKEMEDLRKNGVTREEFERTKRQLRGSYLIGMESPQAHMNALGKRLLLSGKVISIDEVLAHMDSVTMDSVNAIIPEVLDENCLCGAFAGKVNGVRNELEKLF